VDGGVKKFGGHREWGKPSTGVGFVSNRGRLAPFGVSAWKNDSNPRKYAKNLFFSPGRNANRTRFINLIRSAPRNYRKLTLNPGESP
jgi:hypothetical protein